MSKYICKRIIYLIFVFCIVSILMFFLYKLVPQDPVRMMLDATKSSTDPVKYQLMYEAARKQLGLDRPLWVQYVRWITNMLCGDFGYSSAYRMQVIDLVATPLKNTLLLNVSAMILVFAITLPIGVITAVKKNSVMDQVVQVGSVIGYSIPTFIMALLFIYVFAVRLKLVPIGGMNTPGILGGKLAKKLDLLYHMALPLLVMTVGSLGGIIRYVRAAMIDVLSMDYIRTARAKGLSEPKVIVFHAFRNALIPVVTIITSWFVSIFGGSVVIESIFGWNGIGKVLFDAVKQQDYAVVLAMQMFYVVISLLGNLMTDVGYCLVDPRVKLE